VAIVLCQRPVLLLLQWLRQQAMLLARHLVGALLLLLMVRRGWRSLRVRVRLLQRLLHLCQDVP
jgi:hypothetical protein